MAQQQSGIEPFRLRVVTLHRQPLQSNKGRIGIHNDAGRDRFEIVSGTSLCHKPFPKGGTRCVFGNVRHNPPGNIDPSPRREREREIAGHGAKNGTEHIDGGTADRTNAFDGGFGDVRGTPFGSIHTLDRGDRLIKIFQAPARQHAFGRNMPETLAQPIDDNILLAA